MIAKRYAKALFDLCDTTDAQNRMMKSVETLKDVIEGHDQLCAALKAPVVSVAEKKAVMSALCEKLGCDDVTQRWIALLAEHDRLAALPAIAARLRLLVDEAAGIVRARVTAAQALDDNQTKQIQSLVSEVTGKTPELSVETEEELLGGAVIRLGSLMIDGSLSSRLKRMERHLKSTAVAA